MRVITNAELISNAAKAYDEMRLTAQHPTGMCLYHQVIDGRDCGCAIGVSMTSEEIEAISEPGVMVRELVDRGIVAFEDRYFAERMQSHHDGWVACDLVDGGQAAFRAMIGR